MSIISEVYLVARGVADVELSLQESIKVRKEAEKEIHDKVNELGKLEVIDLISMMIPIVTAPLKEPEYFGEIFGGMAGASHAQTFAQLGYSELADTQRLLQALFGVNEKQRFLFSLKEDPNSPAGYSVKRFMLLIDSNDLTSSAPVLGRMLETLGIPEGYSVSVLFNDDLNYTAPKFDEKLGHTPPNPSFDQTVLSNLINTYILTTIAAVNPKIFTGKFDYKISRSTGRSTYFPDMGEVLFEINQPSVAPASWFEIFDKVDLDNFDLKTELANYITPNLTELSKAK